MGSNESGDDVEAARVAALHRLDVLDSAPEAEFDAIVRAASLACGMPISLISLIDVGRQWFKANIGLDGITETPRELAFCAHAIAGEDLFEVADAAADPRFADNNLVVDAPRIRSYAGMPLRLEDGSLVGTLCVIGREPRVLDDTQREVLRSLGQAAARALEARNAALRERETARSLQISEERLRRVYEATPAMLHSVDEDGRLRTVTDIWLTKLGYRREDVIGRPFADFLTPDSAARFGSTADESAGIASELVCKDGSILEVLISAITEPGSHTGRLAVLEDVTTRNRMQRELQDERKRFTATIEATGVGTWQRNIQTGELRMNERCAAQLGYALDELRPLTVESWYDRYHPADRARAAELLAMHCAGATEFYECEKRMLHKDGTWRWMASRGRIVSRSADGQPEWMFGTNLDISWRKRQDEALKKSEKFLDRTGRLAGVGGWELDLATMQMFWSAETSRIHGMHTSYVPSVEEALAFYPSDARTTVRTAVQTAIRDGQGFDLELPFRRADGRDIWVRLVGSTDSVDGAVVRVWGAIQDVTDRVRDLTEVRELTGHLRAEKELLIAAKQAADEASRVKSDFLASMSHEIRTPMNGIIGLTTILLDDDPTPRQRRNLDLLADAGRSLLAIINDILDLSKVEAGRIDLERLPFDPAGVVDGAVSIVRADAAAKGLSVAVDIASDVPRVVVGDPTRIRQILLNLLTNAIKFTERGGVRVTVARGEAGSELLRFSVLDSGIGIAPHLHGRLFEKFSQLDPSINRSYGGTGLGLAICKHLAEAMRGTIGVSSQAGSGSTFWFTACLPPGDALVRDRAERDVERPAGCRILVVDDNPLNAIVANGLLLKDGHTTVVAVNGVEAIAMFRERAFDLILMDVQMPVMNGIEATRILRAMSPAGRAIPIVALSASAMPDEVALCREAGMNDHLAKPIDIDVLRATIRRWTAHEPALPALRIDALRDSLDGNLAIVMRVLQAAHTLIDEDVQRIDAAVAARDGALLTQAAHRLRGTAASLYAERVAALSHSIEHRPDGAPAVTPELLADLHAAAAALRREIDMMLTQSGAGAQA